MKLEARNFNNSYLHSGRLNEMSITVLDLPIAHPAQLVFQMSHMFSGCNSQQLSLDLLETLVRITAKAYLILASADMLEHLDIYQEVTFHTYSSASSGQRIELNEVRINLNTLLDFLLGDGDRKAVWYVMNCLYEKDNQLTERERRQRPTF